MYSEKEKKIIANENKNLDEGQIIYKKMKFQNHNHNQNQNEIQKHNINFYQRGEIKIY